MLRKLALDWTPLRTSPDFRRLWLAQSLSLLGSEIGYTALLFQVYALTRSTLDVGLLSLAQLVPLLTLTIVGGAFADHFDRRLLMLIQQAGMILGGVVVLVNAALPHPAAWPCFVCMVIDACAFSFGVGAQNALIPRIVGDDQLIAANNLNGVIANLASVAGPALAGVIIAASGVVTAYAIDVATFFATLAAVWLLPSLVPEGGEDARPSLRSIVDGFRFVRRSPVILGFMLVDTNAMIFGMPIALFPAIALHRFHDEHALGYLLAAAAAGALVFSALGGWVNHVRRQGLVVIVAAAVWGGAIAAFGLTSHLWLALVLLGIAGGFDQVSAILRGTMLMELTPDALRGRLIGIEFAQVTSAPSLGNLEAGALASATSIRTSIVSGGLACVAGCVVLAALFPALVRYRRAATA
ncbi:MAG: MFS transporter [Actinomycetota bacterium]